MAAPLSTREHIEGIADRWAGIVGVPAYYAASR